VTNEEIAAIFTDIADMLNKKQENLFKIKAYDKVARNILALKEPVTRLAAENRLREIPGVGDAIELKLKEITATGKLEFYEKLKLELKPDLKANAESPARSRL
jgi:DNA polymerase (family X)